MLPPSSSSLQVVPATLLTFTQGVLRERFSSFVPKAVYTFSFDRTTAVTPQLVRKLREAEGHGGLVCSTPNALKSFALAFLHAHRHVRASPLRAASLHTCGCEQAPDARALNSNHLGEGELIVSN